MIAAYIIISIIGFLVIIYFLFCYFLSGTVLYLNRQPVPKNPKNYGMDFEDIEFETSDNVIIKVKKFVNLRSEHPLEKMSPLEYTKDLKVPVLYVQARNDPWTELDDIQSFYDNTPGPKEFYWIEDTKHRFKSYSYFQDNPQKMLEWLAKWI